MQFYKMYSQENRAEIEALIHSQPYCYLVTSSDNGIPHIGIFNHIFDGKHFLLHLNKHDEQIEDLKQNGQALISFHRYLATIPSYWIDSHYGGAATAYYKYVEFQCTVEMITDAHDKTNALQALLNHYQPECGYDPLDPQSDVYKESFSRIVLIRLNPITMRNKWKFAQAKSLDIQEKIVEQLKLRGTHLDFEAVDEIIKINLNREMTSKEKS